MASTFKTFLSDDIASTRTLLHEAIPMTGSIVNGVTYTEGADATTNIKTYGHGMFQSVYDYPYQSSSANHVFDITQGIHPTAPGLGDSTTDYYAKRKNVYNQMAQVLVGHDVNGAIRKFDADGDLTGGTKYNNVFFLNFARLLGKDEIKKGSFSLSLGTTPTFNADKVSMHASLVKISDTGAETNYKVNSPAGEYGILSAETQTGSDGLDAGVNTAAEKRCGLIFYQAGIAVITTDIFENGTDGPVSGYLTAPCEMTPDLLGVTQTMDILLGTTTNSTMDAVSDAIRQRISNISFSNTTELNSTIYFCRVGHNDFNYSSNPTYTTNSKINVKNRSSDAPVSYITTVGLYSSDNEMLAVAKLSEPLRKDPTNDMTLRVRLDY
jgi:hypothetical protein